MRAQLRTYHSIPALQAHQDPNAYKQLQDAPRLKSILKGATEDIEQPSTIDDIKTASVPRTNPVNLIFVLSQYAPKISEIHFFPPRDFFDLVMRSALSSKSRANAFLWLMWWYLESDFSAKDAEANPFGKGLEGEGTGGVPVKVPPFDYLTEEQAALENVDTQSEIDFGEQKKLERESILKTDPPARTADLGPRKGPKKGKSSESFAITYCGASAAGDGLSTAHNRLLHSKHGHCRCERMLLLTCTYTGHNASSVFGMSDDGSPGRDLGTPQPGKWCSVCRICRYRWILIVHARVVGQCQPDQVLVIT
jgi:hypothetical protein